MSSNSSEERRDLRSRRTEQHLRAALTALMAERDLDSITVVDICERAMVHRTTFYKHYEGKAELLDDVLDARLRRLVGPDIRAMPAVPGELGRDAAARLMVQLAGRIEADRDFYGLLLRPDAASLVPRLTDGLRRQLLGTPSGARAIGGDPARAELRAHLHAALIMNAIVWWMGHRDELSADEVAATLVEGLAGRP